MPESVLWPERRGAKLLLTQPCRNGERQGNLAVVDAASHERVGSPNDGGFQDNRSIARCRGGARYWELDLLPIRTYRGDNAIQLLAVAARNG